MNGIISFVLVVGILFGGVGMCMIGAAAVIIALQSTDDMADRFAIRLDFGKRYNDNLEKVCDSLVRITDSTERIYDTILSNKEEDDEDYDVEAIDFSNYGID